MEPESSKKNITKEIFRLESDAIVEMFEIDFSHLQNDFSFLSKKHKTDLGPEPVYRFCSSVNNTNPIIWQGKSYQPLPIFTTDFEMPSDGRLPRPKLAVANPSGLLSTIVLMNYDFHGCKVSRKRTFVKFLDDANFRSRNGEPRNPSGMADPNAHLPDDIFFINRKIAETRESIEFELTSMLEMEGIVFPAREMLADHCSFRYRGLGCNYAGAPCSTETGSTFAKYGITKFTDPRTNQVLESSSWGDNSQHFLNSIKWDVDNSYQKGNVVNWPGIKEPYVPSIFVCIQSHEDPSPNPYIAKDFWIMDSCAKTLGACMKRWGGNLANGETIPFGGFPETASFRHQ